MKNQARQGDVFIIPCVIPKDVREVKTERLVLAEGEATGHAHVAVGDVRMFEKDGTLYLDVEDAEVVHEEHGTVVLGPGTYRVQQQREYSPEEIRNVAD